MKKKIFGGLAVLAIAAMAAFNVNLSAQEENLSTISLANVEALAGGEGEDFLCTYSYADYCIYGDIYVINVRRV
ncbi:NVEALA domain-containing protein [Parabacteroides sp. Marseille-P3160]|uniref:NVEALA domain-containing protein n=1 Tax=Parabacteroides sp. Marseille-P3160 TaxID=1917887 RepID=UPI0009B9C59C|nr:NVEALA domain-containing protein [Parabacteroides sp. Marseille-P3160]